MKTPIIAAAMAAAIGTAGFAAEGDTPKATTPEAGIKAGMLTCELTGGKNFVVISEASYNCNFKVANSDEVEQYTAEIDKLGIDLSVEKAETLKWVVIAATGTFDPGLINGDYIGVSADAAFGLGAGARVQVGGVDDSITLQPVSVSGREGMGIAVGVEHMKLDYQGSES